MVSACRTEDESGIKQLDFPVWERYNLARVRLSTDRYEGRERMRYLLFVMVVIAAVCVTPLFADTVYLKNGGKMRGKVTVTEDQVIIENEMGLMAIPRREVERIEKDEYTPGGPKVAPKPRKTASERAWEVLPEMPHHVVTFEQAESGDRLAGLSPRTATAIFGRVKEVAVEGDNRKIIFEPPSNAVFAQGDAAAFSFFRVDTDSTLAKLLFFSVLENDEITISLAGGTKRTIKFKGVSGANILVKEGIKPAETLAAKTVFMVTNPAGKSRALEAYLEDKGLEEGDHFIYTDKRGIAHMGKLLKDEGGLKIDSGLPYLKLDWIYVDNLSELAAEEYKRRMARISESKSTYSPVATIGSQVQVAVAAYGSSNIEGDGIVGRVGVEGAKTLGLYTRFFEKAGLWISSMKDTVYEIETTKEFTGAIYGLKLNIPLEHALKLSDLYFYRFNVNNPRLMVSHTLSPLRVIVTLDAKMKTIERISVADPNVKDSFEVKAGVIMRRLRPKSKE